MAKKLKNTNQIPDREASLNDRFFERLLNCIDEQKKIQLEHTACINKGIGLCVNVKKEIYVVKSINGKKDKEYHFKYGKDAIKSAEAFLKTFAVKAKTK